MNILNIFRWYERWHKKRQCFHHLPGRYATTAPRLPGERPGESWIKEQLIDFGMRKMFWCSHCQRTWFS